MPKEEGAHRCPSSPSAPRQKGSGSQRPRAWPALGRVRLSPTLLPAAWAPEGDPAPRSASGAVPTSSLLGHKALDSQNQRLVPRPRRRRADEREADLCAACPRVLISQDVLKLNPRDGGKKSCGAHSTTVHPLVWARAAGILPGRLQIPAPVKRALWNPSGDRDEIALGLSFSVVQKTAASHRGTSYLVNTFLFKVFFSGNLEHGLKDSHASEKLFCTENKRFFFF